ncbi:protocadherin alpha-2 [Microtus ochrogaster]|uniref:Protocadherin alpha-2 n=1 Tax=Microtus ochrogaster TaxID=79684 RepID=A0ABM1UBL0_MICOH|nr:protocadherin alpha-2 [Microtus ochrogaster]
MPSLRGGPDVRQCLLLWLLLLSAWEAGSGQLHYSISEEAKHGTFVGRIAQDLGLELAELVPRLFRVASKDRGDLLEVNLQNGILFVNSRIDREALCGRSAECSIHLEVIVDRPLQVFHVEVEVRDINDNPPLFPTTEKTIQFHESRLLDSRFPLEGASDADIGVNALLSYKLSPSEFFFLDVQTNDELSQSLFLVLGKSLDREENAEVKLLLVATDGGKPELTGSVQILIKVLDVNDNEPTFPKSVYKVQLLENTANGTLVVKLNASDADEGPNSEIVYSLSSDVSSTTRTKFQIDPTSGEIRTKEELDYEERTSYEIQVIASDKGTPPMSGHCKISVKLLDINDNTPEVSITSLSLPVQENASLGAVIALISVTDRDSGINGQVTCSLTPQVPFKLVSTFKNYYSLVLDSALDRETTPDYKVVVTARDGGSPSLWATASVSVEVADVNDNVPTFAQPEYTVFVKENNPPGAHIFTVSAMDADAQENALVSYSLVERRVGERSLSSFVSVHAESGKVFALQPLDHEELELLQFQVSARDAGVPSLGSNSLLENSQAPKASSKTLVDATGREVSLVDVNVYLIIAICAVSSLLVLTLLLYTALRCSATPTDGACALGKPVLVCSSEVGTWSFSQQRRQRVCSGEGPPKTDLMAFSPSLSQGPESAEERQPPLESEYLAKVGLRFFLSCQERYYFCIVHDSS